MSSLDPTSIQKPVERIHPDNFPAEARHPEVAAAALKALIEHSAKHPDVRASIHAPMHRLLASPHIAKLIPGIEQLASQYHVGNFVALRGTDIVRVPLAEATTELKTVDRSRYAEAEVFFG